MHYLLHMLVDYDTEEEDPTKDIESAVEDALECHQGSLYDWYDVGGRWEGVYEGNRTFLNLAADADEVRKILQDVKESQTRMLQKSLRDILGTPTTAADVPAHVMGFPVNDPEGAALRMTTNSSASYARLRLLQTEPERALSTDDFSFCTLAMALSNAGDLIMGSAFSECLFLDSVNGSSKIGYAEPMIGEGSEHLWLVAVDLHN